MGAAHQVLPLGVATVSLKIGRSEEKNEVRDTFVAYNVPVFLYLFLDSMQTPKTRGVKQSCTMKNVRRANPKHTE